VWHRGGAAPAIPDPANNRRHSEWSKPAQLIKHWTPIKTVYRKSNLFWGAYALNCRPRRGFKGGASNIIWPIKEGARQSQQPRQSQSPPPPRTPSWTRRRRPSAGCPPPPSPLAARPPPNAPAAPRLQRTCVARGYQGGWGRGVRPAPPDRRLIFIRGREASARGAKKGSQHSALLPGRQLRPMRMQVVGSGVGGMGGMGGGAAAQGMNCARSPVTWAVLL
jgi:hypothetical protein